MPEQVPRHAFDSEAAEKLLRAKHPVVLTGSGLVDSSVSRWTLEYLREHVGDAVTFDVYASAGNFLYSNEEKNAGGYDFESNVRKYTSTFGNFVDEIKRRSRAQISGNSSTVDDGSDSTNVFICSANQDNDGEPAEKIYLQNMLFEGLGEAIVRDFQEWKWGWAHKWQKALGFGPLSTNMLLVGQRGVITPTHYDEQQNFFAQIAGRKVVTLYSPADFRCLYPYPVGHPADRQSQVLHEKPDLDRFPLFAGASASETTLAPGEVRLHVYAYAFACARLPVH
jgi:hypoxia-inducible factor 1-alpha inhibitor (HIF hydroxylase)